MWFIELIEWKLKCWSRKLKIAEEIIVQLRHSLHLIQPNVLRKVLEHKKRTHLNRMLESLVCLHLCLCRLCPQCWMGDCPAKHWYHVSNLKLRRSGGKHASVFHRLGSADFSLYQSLVSHQSFQEAGFSAWTVWTIRCYHHIAMVTRQILSLVTHTEWKGEMTAMWFRT